MSQCLVYNLPIPSLVAAVFGVVVMLETVAYRDSGCEAKETVVIEANSFYFICVHSHGWAQVY